ncbi:MAG: phasin family protein [Phyllobacteriaceae bacterium]|nr:phasin family protein [Phyllobacteriaceae bacterium]
MAKKLKALAAGTGGEGNEKALAKTIKDSAYQIWLAGLGAFAKAQEEGTKVFEALVKEGESVQKRTKKVAEDTVNEARKTATGTWDKLESVFEDRVARALASLNVPTRKDIDALSARVHDLTSATKKLSGTVTAETTKTAKGLKASAKKVAKSATAVKDEAAEVMSASVKIASDETAKVVKMARDETAKVVEDVKKRVVG